MNAQRTLSRLPVAPWMAGVALALIPVAGCRPAPDRSAAPPADLVLPVEVEERAQAEAATQELMQTLMAELTAALGEGGPEAAVRICSERAQELTREIGERRGLSIRRTSLRVRNPANAPDEDERRVLRMWNASDTPPEPYEHVAVAVDGEVPVDGSTEYLYMRPIILATPCTTCHGDPGGIPPTVAATIRERYPQDEATGFAAGDLRGAVSVRIPRVGR